MKLLKRIAVASIGFISLLGCQGNVNTAKPLPNAEPLISSLNSNITNLPDSYFYPLAKETVIGIQVKLYKLNSGETLWVTGDGKRYIKTSDNKMIEVGKVNKKQLKMVGELYKPALLSPKITNAIIEFSNGAIGSELGKSLGVKELTNLSSACFNEMAGSAFKESHNLSFRHNSLLNPENFSDTKRFNNKQRTADFLQSEIRKLLNDKVPSISMKGLVRPAVEYCVDMDYKIGNAIKKAVSEHIRSLANSSHGDDRTKLDNLVALVIKNDAETGAPVRRKSEVSPKAPQINSSMIRCLANDGTERIVTEKTCKNLLKGAVISR